MIDRPPAPPWRVFAALTLASLLALGTLTACSSKKEDAPELTPAETMAAAKTKLDETPGVKVVLTSSGLPDGVNSVAAADGVGNSSPAFKGTIDVTLSGQQFQVPVVAVGDKVYAQIPLTTGWSDIDPGDYNAPNPAMLLSRDSGFSALLVATSALKKGESQRGGTDNKEILTSYTGTVDGATMAGIIPTATGDFDATYTVGDDNRVREMAFTGTFYPDTEPMTYTVNFSAYDVATEITPPEGV
ncbi:MAG: LppX_LprAFG lipoprotein [Nocardioides sp.]